jgi:glutamine---fructose-6-phosphate transaminase (isomerizing)
VPGPDARALFVKDRRRGERDMCGVMGYVGRRRAKERLLDGLERLEYRGYDSAGICLLQDRTLESVRAVGKLENLKGKVTGSGSRATTGIGHTRWATHGRVTERNAHPLVSGNGHGDEVAIVLNGIVENHAQLRAELVAEGYAFVSETDAEVVAHLLRAHYAGSLVDAVAAVARRLEGHFAFVAVHRDEPELLAGTRRRCPLLVGIGEGETFLASSLTAFARDTRRIKVIEDDEIVAVRADAVRIVTLDGRAVDREAVLVPGEDDVADRGSHETFMLKEIHEQPAAIADTITANLKGGALDLGSIGAEELAKVRRLVIVACGTAYHAAQVGGYAIEEWAGIPCDQEVASEWRYRNPLMEPGTLVIGISQSGETADTLASLRLARERGARTLAITNSPGSQITREVDAVLLTHAGIEIGVAATKTFTTQVALLSLLALRLAELRGRLDEEERARLTDEVKALPYAVFKTLSSLEGVEEVAQRHHAKRFFFFLGRHAGLPVCLEGALKLKEVSYIPTESYAAGEMKHGPIALLDDETPVVCVATRSHVADKLASNLQEVRARGAEVIAVATEGDERIRETADHVLYVPDTHPLLQPVVAVIPLQLLAYRIAGLRGLDVDQPRNLAKTVTVE